MADKITQRLVGSEELEAKLKELGRGIDRVLEAGAKAGAVVLADEANLRAPGRHVVMEKDERRSQPGSITFGIGPDKERWYYQFFETGAQPHEIRAGFRTVLAFPGEFGMAFAERVFHTGMAAVPFLRPAFDAKWQAARDAVGTLVRHFVEHV